MSNAFRAAAIMLTAMFSHGAAADDVDEESLALMNQFTEFFQQRQYEELEKVAQVYRSPGARMTDGTWKLTAFYSGASFLVPRGESALDQSSEGRTIFAEWMARYPKSPTPIIAYASFLKDFAWQFRGTGFANEVWEEDMDKFHSLLKEARQLLKKHKVVADSDPEWYNLLIKCMGWLGEDRGVLLETAREGLRKEPRYWAIHASVTGALKPEWGGSGKLIEEWARESIKLSAPEDGMSMYARIYWQAEDSLIEAKQDIQWANWQLVRSGMDDILKLYPSRRNKEQAVNFACRANDPEEVRRRFATANPEMEPRDLVAFDPVKGCRNYLLDLPPGTDSEPAEPAAAREQEIRAN